MSTYIIFKKGYAPDKAYHDFTVSEIINITLNFITSLSTTLTTCTTL